MQQPIVYEYLIKSIFLGIFATFIMDMSNLLGKSLGLHKGGSYKLIGRWIRGFFDGQFVYNSILEAPPRPQESLIGLVSHYLIGVGLAFIYLVATLNLGFSPDSWGWALGFGILTNILPWFVMFPAFGFGFLASKGPPANTLLSSSFCNHLGYGFALGAGSLLLPVFF